MSVDDLRQLREEAAETRQFPESLKAYLPPCSLPDCPDKGRTHKHILPHQGEFILAPEKYLAMNGGYGAAKTLTGAVLGVLLSTKVHHNRGFVGRRTYSKLHDSTLPIYLEVLQRRGVDFEMKEVRDGFPHRIVIKNLDGRGQPIDSEIVFRETKDLGRWLGPEYGWFHIDEASEEPKSTFVGLQGRLRLSAARRYLKGFITSNPPHHTHWIAEVFGTTPGVTQRGGAHYRLWRVASTANPFLPSGYVDDLKANHPPSEVRRIIEGEYGFSFEGKAVYMPPFDFGRHVTELEPVKNTAIVRSWDFGYHTPAVVWQQFPVCPSKTVHYLVVAEYVGRDLESEQLADVVLDLSRSVFPDHPPALFLDAGDRAGAQRSEKGPGPIIRLQRPPYGLRFKHRNIPNIDPGLALLREALRGSCPCGRPVFQINRTCRHLIDALAGGYHYPQPQNGSSHAPKDKPKKDGFYDNVADALRYGAENFYRNLLHDPDVLDRIMRDTGPQPLRPDMGGTGFGWLDQVTPMQSQALREERERVVAQGGV